MSDTWLSRMLLKVEFLMTTGISMNRDSYPTFKFLRASGVNPSSLYMAMACGVSLYAFIERKPLAVFWVSTFFEA
jgi:predicted transcriptional regulator of viral defense system